MDYRWVGHMPSPTSGDFAPAYLSVCRHFGAYLLLNIRFRISYYTYMAITGP